MMEDMVLLIVYIWISKMPLTKYLTKGSGGKLSEGINEQMSYR